MSTSYNGFPASTDPKAVGIVPLVIGGVPFVGGVKGGDVALVLGYVATQYDKRVEPLTSPGCWGWSYRQNRNANNLSNHSSGTAIDCNAPKHPNGVDVGRTFSNAQIQTVHTILAEIPELSAAVHWGGDWTRANGLTPDSMHFEIHDHDTARLARVAKRIKEAAMSNALPPTKVTTARALLAEAMKTAGPIRKAAIKAGLAVLPKR